MSFVGLLKNEKVKTNCEQPERVIAEAQEQINEAPKKPEEILRGAGYKIKLVTPTSFGTQIDFAKSYEQSAIKELLKDFTIKIKNKSVFIVD